MRFSNQFRLKNRMNTALLSFCFKKSQKKAIRRWLFCPSLHGMKAGLQQEIISSRQQL
jgi:hypothetical protein